MKRIIVLLTLVASIFVVMNVSPVSAQLPGGAGIENSCAASITSVFAVEEAQACGSYPTPIPYIVWCNQTSTDIFYILWSNGNVTINPWGCW